MSSSFNRVILLGNLTRDPELKYLAGKRAVNQIGIAINERYKKDDEDVESVTYVEVTYYGRVAEVINEYLTKGSSILVEGKLRLNVWEKDGQKRQRLEVIGERMQMIGNRSVDSSTEDSPEPVGVGNDEEIPY